MVTEIVEKACQGGILRLIVGGIPAYGARVVDYLSAISKNPGIAAKPAWIGFT